jgi:ATP phosphoribosyltransferase
MNNLTLAVQKSGRLSEKTLSLLSECGINISNGERKLKADAANFPLQIIFLRDDDIPQYVEQGVAHIGILGENVVWETGKDLRIVEKLGFAQCRLSLAIPKDEHYTGLGYFEGKKIATSYPKILENFFRTQNIGITVEEIGGSVEVTTGIGLADAIFDIVSTGSTLLMNGLKEVEVVAKSEAVLVATQHLEPAQQEILEKFLFRLKSVRAAAENRYILLNAPNDRIEDICRMLPGMKSPTVMPLADEGWSSIHSVVKEDEFWEKIERLKAAGAQGILVFPIQKMIL